MWLVGARVSFVSLLVCLVAAIVCVLFGAVQWVSCWCWSFCGLDSMGLLPDLLFLGLSYLVIAACY